MNTLKKLFIQIYDFSFVFSKFFWGAMIVNLLLILGQFFYIGLRHESINTQVPIFYTQPWGLPQLAEKSSLYLIPTILLTVLPFVGFFYVAAKKYFLTYADQIVLVGLTITNIILLLSTIRIIHIASSQFTPFSVNLYVLLLFGFFGTFLATTLITPKFIQIFKKNNIVTNPQVHLHPSMLLVKPTARGGGVIFAVIFIIGALIFAGTSKLLLGIYFGVAALSILGLLDDYQNTNPKSVLKILENPLIRLLLLPFLVLIPIAFGIRIDFINNPFNGILNFDSWVAILFTIFWFVWVLNVLSWSNGVNGQYSGIVGIACIVIAILALRFTPLEGVHTDIAKLAIVAAGASFGLARYTWEPSRIMWGFGAMAAGLVIATASVVIGSKIATGMIIILVPFLDAVVTVTRRIMQGKNPLKGDKGHLHHLLLDRGWSVQQIALFYWGTTALFGVIGILSANSDMLLVTLTLIGIVAFFIISLNVISIFAKKS